MARLVRYCVECGWRLRESEHKNTSELMIKHALETDHDVSTCAESDNGDVKHLASGPPDLIGPVLTRFEQNDQ